MKTDGSGFAASELFMEVVHTEDDSHRAPAAGHLNSLQSKSLNQHINNSAARRCITIFVQYKYIRPSSCPKLFLGRVVAFLCTH